MLGIVNTKITGARLYQLCTEPVKKLLEDVNCETKKVIAKKLNKYIIENLTPTSVLTKITCSD